MHRQHGVHSIAFSTPYVERLIGSIRRECLDHLIVVNERHLRVVLEEFVRHYNKARPHRALALEVPRGEYGWEQVPDASRVRSREILGPYGYHRVDPPYRLWIWKQDLA